MVGNPPMTLKHFLKRAVIGIAVALMVLVIGVVGQMAWPTLRLPGVHRAGGAAATTATYL